MTSSFANFDLHVTAAADGFRVQALDPSAHRASGEFAALFDAASFKPQAATTSSEKALRSVGTGLYTALFAGEVGRLWEGSLDAARRSEQSLRLRPDLDGARDLDALPWEGQYSPAASAAAGLPLLLELRAQGDEPLHVSLWAINAHRAVPVTFEADPGQLPPPEIVEVRLIAPSFREQTGVWERTMMVYSSRGSQPVVFLLETDNMGRKRLTLDFYHKDRMIGTVNFESEVVQEATGEGATVTLRDGQTIGAFIANPPPPADLELRVVRTIESNALIPRFDHGQYRAADPHSQPPYMVKPARDNETSIEVEILQGKQYDAAAADQCELIGVVRIENIEPGKSEVEP